MTGIDGNYRMTCESVMEVLRSHRDSVMAVLEAFVYDPLLNWRLMDGNDSVTSAPSLSVFRSRLKSHLFERSFPADSY